MAWVWWLGAALLLGVVEILSVDLVLIMTTGGPGISSTTWALESYLTAYKSADFGQGAAYAVTQAAILCIFIAIYLRLTRDDGSPR